MNGETILTDPSYLTCEINGSQFIFQTLENSLEDLKPSESENDSINFVSKDEDSIPLVCLDGQIYALQNGQLQKLDLTQLSNQEYEDESAKNCSAVPEEVINSKQENPEVLEENYPLENLADIGANREEPVLQESTEICDDLVEDKTQLDAMDFIEVVTAFKCKICPYTIQDRAELLKHFENVHANPQTPDNDDTSMETEDVKLLYMCGECSSCFPTMENCREHMIKDHQLMDRTTPKPDDANSENFENIKAPDDSAEKNSKKPTRPMKNTKINHLNNAENMKNIEIKEREVKCSYRGCLHKFSTEELMQRHISCHTETQNPNSFKCSICPDMKFPRWKNCSLHLWKKHKIDIDLLPCTICKNYRSATSVKLLTHMRVHSESRDFECQDCGKCFKQPSQLRNHRVMHLDRKSIEGPRWYTSKTCEMCGKTYADAKCLKNHMQAVHSKLRPYVCSICGHSSARKAMLQMHLRQHTGDKPFNCDICDYKTGDHNSLRRHVMRHTGVRPYKCPHCSYSAIQSSSYKNHLRAKHPHLSGIFTCDLCPFKTVKKESYMEHIGDHEKGLIKATTQKKDDDNVEVFPGNIAAAQLIYSCLGAFSKVGKTIEASLMSSSTSADGTSQTITIQIPSKDLEGSLPITENPINKNPSNIEQEDDETMHCFMKIPHEEDEENIDTGGITIPAEPEESTMLNI